MKVLLVTNGFPPRGQWGTETYTLEVARGLARRGHEVHVLHPERSGARPRYTMEELDGSGFRVHLLHNPGDPRKAFARSYADAQVESAVAGLFARLRPDVAHCTYLLWGLSVRLPVIARAAGVAAVATLTDYGLLCHRAQMVDWRLERCGGPHPPTVCARCIRAPSRYELGPLARPARRALAEALAALGGVGRVPTTADLAAREAAVREALGACAALIAPTRVLADVFVRAGVPRERIEELVYAIDVEPFAAARAQPAGPPAPPVIGFLGQFAPHKGLDTLLAAVAIMRARLPESVMPWELWLYGSPSGGRHRRYWPSLAPRAGPPRVRVMQPFPASEAPRVLAGLSAVALPSIWDENAPLVALQARAAGVPVVGSSVPGIREVIEHGIHGRLVPPGDAPALADALRDLLLAGCRRTGAAGAPLALDAHVDRLEAIYARACRTS